MAPTVEYLSKILIIQILIGCLRTRVTTLLPLRGNMRHIAKSTVITAILLREIQGTAMITQQQLRLQGENTGAQVPLQETIIRHLRGLLVTMMTTDLEGLLLLEATTKIPLLVIHLVAMKLLTMIGESEGGLLLLIGILPIRLRLLDREHLQAFLRFVAARSMSDRLIGIIVVK